MTKKCIGCGKVLQNKDPNIAGYIPQNKLKDCSLCARCFKINHYNQIDLLSVPLNNFQILKSLDKSNAIAFFMIDFLNINSETIATYHKINIPKLLVISKSDIIPKSIKRQKILEWLKEIYRIKEDIVFLSTNKNSNINFIDEYLESYSKIYLLGYTNAGKSTYINNIINRKIGQAFTITTSMIPNTTLDFININLSPNNDLIDSPGFTYQNNIYLPTEIELIKKINPKKFISPITYQLKELTSINIEDKIIISQTKSSNSFTFYMSNSLNINKIYNTIKFNNFSQKEYQIANNSDLVIKGVGFINIKKATTLIIYSDYQDLIEIRPSLFN